VVVVSCGRGVRVAFCGEIIVGISEIERRGAKYVSVIINHDRYHVSFEV